MLSQQKNSSHYKMDQARFFFGSNVAFDGKIGYGSAFVVNSNGSNGFGVQVGLLVFLNNKSE